MARGKQSRVAIVLPGARLKPQLLILIQAAQALGREGGREGGRASLSRLGAGAGALCIIRTCYVCAYGPLLVFLCCALHVG